MATTDLESVFSMLFTAPSEAVVRSEAEFRRIWVQWLRDLKKLIDARNALPSPPSVIEFNEQLELAPVMKFTARVEAGITMRVATVRQTEAKASLGLGLSILQVSGSFGFSSQDTQESVLQAKAQYAMTNTNEVTLKDYLKDFSIELAKPEDIDNAVNFLKTPPAEEES